MLRRLESMLSCSCAAEEKRAAEIICDCDDACAVRVIIMIDRLLAVVLSEAIDYDNSRVCGSRMAGDSLLLQ